MGMFVQAQCGLDKTYTIFDKDNNQADTTDIKILVNGAKFNDLSTTQQGVCGVQIRFRHPFMKELFIELISPSGQKITLVGGDIFPTNTQLITWDVFFVPCNSSAAPDFGFQPVWENNQAWQNLTTYRGQYYPHMGCFEDLNMGAVDGVWTIRCIDYSDGGQGVLQDAKLVFCEDEGVVCGQCQLNPGTITNDNLEACMGSSALIFNIEKTFPQDSYDTTNYVYTNVLFNSDTLLQYVNNPDLTGYPPGNYTICGLQIAKFQQSVLPEEGSIIDRASLNEFFAESGACALISDDCMEITIIEPHPVQIITHNICKGDSVVINGQTYRESGHYDIIIKQYPCDSLITLVLNVVDLFAVIEAEKDSIGCGNSFLLLEGSALTTFDGELSYYWFTYDGMISGSNDFQEVEVVSIGRYFLEVTLKSQDYTCKDTTSILIKEDESYPLIDFQSDTILNCLNSNLDVEIELSTPVETVVWTSAEGNAFQQLGRDIRVSEPGKYYVEVVTAAGCIGKDSILIYEDRVIPQLQFEYGLINCKDTVITINTTTMDNRRYLFEWSNVDPLFKNAQNPEVNRGGSYNVTVTNLENGCASIETIEVVEDKSPPIISNVAVDTLNCKLNTVNPKVLPGNDISAILWTGNGLNSMEISPSISIAGTYTVEITSSISFCKQVADFEVTGDYVVPSIFITTDSITCLVDSVRLLTMGDRPLFNINWTGPTFTLSGILSPFVHRAGIYTIEAEASNGCKATASVEVINSKYKPEIIIENDSIHCDDDFIVLSVSPDLPDRSYVWSGPGILNNDVVNPSVSLPGLYEVTVTNTITGCTFETDILIGDARIFSKPMIRVGQIDCAHDSVRVMLDNKDILSVYFFGNGFSSTDVTPYIKEPGKYYVQLTNIHHCVSLDSFEVKNNIQKPVVSADFKFLQCGQDSVLLQGKSNISRTRFVWSGPEGFNKSGQNVYGYVGGNYRVTGTAPNGCTMDYDFEIGYDTVRPIFRILPADTLTCMRPEIVLQTDFDTSNGKVEWEINGFDQNTLFVQQPDVYKVAVTGLNNCVSEDSIQVFENKNFPSFEVISTIINCRNLVAMIEVTPRTEFTEIFWDNVSNPDVIDDGKLFVWTSFSGIYNFTVFNKEGCLTTGEIEVVADNMPPEVIEIFLDTINCNNPSVDIGVSVEGEVIEYLWNSNEVFDQVTQSGMLSTSTPGMYYLKITGSNFCVENVLFDIVKDDDLPKYTIFGDTLTCNKGKVRIGVLSEDENLVYNWKGPDNFESTEKQPIVFNAGLYLVEIEGNNGCKVTDSVFVQEINLIPQIAIVSDTFFLPCDRSEVAIDITSASNLQQYFWVFPNGDIDNNSTLFTNVPGQYRVQASDQYGCFSGFLYFDVVIDLVVPDIFIGLDTITCSRQEAVLTVSSAYPNIRYEWVSPSGNTFEQSTINTTEPGSYKLITFNRSGCTDSIDVYLAVDTLKPFIVVELFGEIICQKADVTLDATGSNHGKPFSVNWETIDGNIVNHLSDSAIQVDKEGHYQIWITDMKNGCVNTDVIRVDESPSNLTELTFTVTPPYCDQIQNGTIQIDSLNGTAPYMIALNGLDVSGQRFFEDLRSGNYNIVVTDANGCSLIQTVEVPHNGSLALELESEILIYFGDSVLIQPNINGVIFGDHRLRWFVRDSLICDGCSSLTVSPFVNTIYQIEHSIDGLCKEITSILIRVNREMSTAVPNIFNPNSINRNDRFYIPQLRGIKNIKRLLIFDKWAENVYSIYDTVPGIYETGWDGTFKGKQCAAGVYVIIADIELVNGNIWTYKGDITLIR